MTETARPLPTDHGHVIGWAKYFGTIHFFTAVLSYGGTNMPNAWWMVGQDDPLTPEQLTEIVQDGWADLGCIVPEIQLPVSEQEQ